MDMPILFGYEPPQPDWPLSVPMAMLEPHRKQAQINHQQTIERLAQRGGLSPLELLAVLEDRPWKKMDKADAMREVALHLERFSS